MSQTNCESCDFKNKHPNQVQIYVDDITIQNLLKFTDGYYDTGTCTMKRETQKFLCEAGLIRWRGQSRYSLTSIGEKILRRYDNANNKPIDNATKFENEQRKAEDKYFSARPQIFRTGHQESIFRAGFKAAWEICKNENRNYERTN